MKKRSTRRLVREEASVLELLFPAGSKVLLSGGGRQFIERIGTEATRRAIHHVMMGENLRTQTEPLSRRRLSLLSGAIVTLFARGLLGRPKFIEELSSLAVAELAASSRGDNARIWPAQWLIGLTGKSVQNVLRSDPEAFARYVKDFEAAVTEASTSLKAELGDVRMTLGFMEESSGARAELDWRAITRLTAAIGSQTLTIRGSDKSIYGKLFERLILGSFLSMLGYSKSEPGHPSGEGAFWLSDSSDIRESDATLLVRKGQLARFDIGFIGPGNSEISKDKLSRYAREYETARGMHSSKTFIVVDRLPRTGKTEAAAKAIGAEIVQMSMAYWPRTLAQQLGRAFGVRHEIDAVPDDQMAEYLRTRLASIDVQEFLAGVSVNEADDEAATAYTD